MKDTNNIEVQIGLAYAHELLLTLLLKDYLARRIPGTEGDMDHLDSFVRDLQSAFLSQRPNMSQGSAQAAEDAIFRVLTPSCLKYWKKS